MTTHPSGTRLPAPLKPVLAIDGEGWEVNGRHVYGFLANSDGYEIYDVQGLSTYSCLSFLCNYGKDRLNVVFSGHYDITWMLKDLTPEQAREAMKDEEGGGFGRGVIWNGFKIRYVPRKYLYVRRGDEKGVMLWDVWGFFQGSFLEALEKWFGSSYSELQLIHEGKIRRSEFKPGDIDFLRRYNAAELRALAKLMEALIAASEEVSLHLSRFDGAGAVAAAMLKKHDIKKRVFLREDGKEKVRLPVNMRLPAERAYYGGRVECFQYGYTEEPIYHYDINSAYPSVLIDLPNIGRGVWEHIDDNPAFFQCPKMALFRVKWDVGDEIICPFPYRSLLQKKILYPTCGESWIWYPEVAAALSVKKPDWKLEIPEAWIFHPGDETDKPYSFIGDYYQQRVQMVKDGNGAEKILKLGLNSLYGKTAQRTGAKPFHSLALAGYITSATRAKLYLAGMQAPESIISFATDGVFSLKPLNLYCPKDKELGAWEFKKHDGAVFIQSGYYILKDGDNYRIWSRGFQKFAGEGATQKDRDEDYQRKVRAHIEQLRAAWKAGKDKVIVPVPRFMGLKSALTGDNFKNLGQFFEVPRDLKIEPINTKRTTDLSFPQPNPAEGMVHTVPMENYSPDEISAPYRAAKNDHDFIDEDVDIPT